MNRETPSPNDQSASARRDAARTLAKLLLSAEDYERRAGSSSDSEEWFCAESESLLRWAGETGRLLSVAEYGSLLKGFKLLDGGLEHQVFWRKREGRLFKITKPPRFGDSWFLKDYVENIIRCNALLDDDMRLEGVLETRDGVSLVMSQPYIVGSPPTLEEIGIWFQAQGCVRIAPQKWQYPSGVVISDAHTGNLILRSDGSLFPIDLHVRSMGNVRIASTAELAVDGWYNTPPDWQGQRVTGPLGQED